MKKKKPLIVLVFCGKAWILNKMALAIKETLKSKYHCIVAYSGHLQTNPDFFKQLPVDAFINLVPMDTDMKKILNGDEKVITSVHHWVDEKFYEFFKENFKDSNYIITDSNEWKNKLIEKGISIPITTIHAFVEEYFFSYFTSKKINDKITLGTFAMIHSNDENDRKGTRHLINLAKHIKDKGMADKFRIVLSGGGWNKIITAIKSYGIEVNYYPSIADKDMPKLFQKLDFYLMLSDVEGGPVGLIEAMASKVFVLSNKIGLALDIGIDKENLVFVDNNNSKEIFDKLIYYYDSQDEYIKITNNAFKVTKEYTPQKVYSAYINILEELLDKEKIQYGFNLDMKKIQRECDKYGIPAITNRRIYSDYEKIFYKILKLLLKVIRIFIPFKNSRQKLKELYKNW